MTEKSHTFPVIMKWFVHAGHAGVNGSLRLRAA